MSVDCKLTPLSSEAQEQKGKSPITKERFIDAMSAFEDLNDAYFSARNLAEIEGATTFPSIQDWANDPNTVFKPRSR